MADDPFAFETILRAIAGEYEVAARGEPHRWLPITEASARVLSRITGEGRPRASPRLREAAARASVPRKRASR